MIGNNYQNFWGRCNGSEIDRNLKANELLNKMLDECVWINIYTLHSSSRIIEVSLKLILDKKLQRIWYEMGIRR